MNENEQKVLNNLQNIHNKEIHGITKNLLACGWASRDNEGNPRLTEAGKQALFRHACISSLDKIVSGAATDVSDSAVYTWLISEKFIKPGASLSSEVVITRRGIYWIASMSVAENKV